MAQTLMDIRRARPGEVMDLLRRQVEDWKNRLAWDRSAFLPQVEPLVRGRRLGGWLLHMDGSPAGLAFAGEQDRAATLELSWVRPEDRSGDALSWLLAEAARELAAACPDRRIEIGLFPFGAPDPGDSLGRQGFQGCLRHYMAAPAGKAGRTPRLAVEPWPANLAGPARLLQQAYAGTPDAEAGSFYRTLGGCQAYLEALTRGSECGHYAPELSGVLSGPGGRLLGMVLGTVLSPGVAHLAQIAVHPARQAAGVGRRLLDHFRDGSAALGIGRLTLLATRTNRPAYDWYRRLGFRPVEPFLSYWRDPAPAR